MHRWLRIRQSAAALRRLITSFSVRLEVSSKCQLKCPMCPTATGFNRDGVVGWGNLTLAAFGQFIEANPNVGHIEISNWGEIFLNPELDAILQRAYDSGILLTANNGVNFNSVRDSTLEAMVKYRLRSLTIAIDGARADSYAEYRKAGNFDRVIGNIEKLNEYKRQHQSRYPILTWQFVIFGHNEHELNEAKAIARSFGMKFSVKLNAEGWGPQFSPVRNREMVRAASGLGVASFAEFREKHGRDYLTPCQDMWSLPQVNWDGKLLGCCVNMWGDFGNVFETSLEHCLSSEKYTYTQKMLLGEVEARADSPCVQCHLYQNRALPKLIDSTWSPRIARAMLASRIKGRGRNFFSAGAQEASTYLRKFRGWMNRRREAHRLNTKIV